LIPKTILLAALTLSALWLAALPLTACAAASPSPALRSHLSAEQRKAQFDRVEDGLNSLDPTTRLVTLEAAVNSGDLLLRRLALTTAFKSSDPMMRSEALRAAIASTATFVVSISQTRPTHSSFMKLMRFEVHVSRFNKSDGTFLVSTTKPYSSSPNSARPATLAGDRLSMTLDVPGYSTCPAIAMLDSMGSALHGTITCGRYDEGDFTMDLLR
jgi:hypothetical protein